MAKVKDGDTVTVHYTGKLESGEVFDSSLERDPIAFTIGAKNVIAGFENGVMDMEVGDKKTIKIEPDDGYGPRKEELVINVEKKDLSSDVQLSVGQQLKIQNPNGPDLNVLVIEEDEEKVVLDANHPLAGRVLFFDVELMDIE